MNLFKKKVYIPLNAPAEPVSAPEKHAPAVPDGVYEKCPHCGKPIYAKALDAYKICPETDCGGYFRMSANDRVAITADEGSFVEHDKNMTAKNPVDYPNYEAKLKQYREKTGLNDAVVTGRCAIGGEPCELAVMDSAFSMASMGSVVGEKMTRAFEYAAENMLPVVIFTASGGARMQEGIISLMQMAKVSAAAKRHSDKGLLYITVITDPTMGGVSASFAALGDIILAEPKAIIGFTGRRVIEQTIHSKLPENFQSAEFMLEHGFIDKIVERREMKDTLADLLRLHNAKNREAENDSR